MGFENQAFDEHRDETGALRPGYDQLFEALDGVDLSALSAAVAQELEQAGVSFGTEPFVVDPVPRLIRTSEWEELAVGLAQRARALNRFLHDAYGAREIVAAGLITEASLHQAAGFEPELMGRLPSHGAPAAIIGFDVVREPSGRFMVLEDNARTPSGFAYALAARIAVSEALPADCPQPRPIAPVTYQLLARALVAVAPSGVVDPSIVLLSDGPHNVAYSEHASAAEALGVPMVTLEQLYTEGERLHVRLTGGETRGVDVLYRRCNEDRIRDGKGRLTAVAELTLPAWLSGRLGLVNAFGTGLADDKFVYRHVEDFIRFYLEEEPIVASVPTYELGGNERGHEPEDLREQVVKPRHGHGGVGVVIGPHASHEELERLALEIEVDPERYISQPPIALSRHPTVIDGQLELRHVDLRAFTFCAAETGVMPGGLSRVALKRGELVVNSSRDGGGKDTWVIG